MDWTSCSIKLDNDSLVPTLSCLPLLITSFINWALIFAGIVAIFLTIYAGYKYINSGGDPKQADTARKTLMYTVFGLILIFLSFFIVRFIGQVSGLDKNCYSMFGFSNCASDSSSDKKCPDNLREVPNPNNSSEYECLSKNWPNCTRGINSIYCGRWYNCSAIGNEKGQCVPKTAAKKECETYADCKQNEACSSNKCKPCDGSVYGKECGKNLKCLPNDSNTKIICKYDPAI